MKSIGNDMQRLIDKEEKREAKRLSKSPIIHECGNHPESIALCKALLEMVGSTILDAGFIKKEYEGGMAFDFDKNGKKMRLVIGYNELGQWIKCLTEIK